MIWVPVVFICSLVFRHCDDGNAFDRLMFNQTYPSEQACAAAAPEQLKELPRIAANATMVCERR